MNQPHFVSQPCPKCNFAVHVVPEVGVGICPQCHTQVQYARSASQAHRGAPPTTSYYSQQPMPTAQDLMKNPLGAVSSFFGRFGAMGTVIGVVVVGALAVGGYYVKSYFFGSGKGSAGYGALGLDPGKPDGDKMITSVEGIAKRWKKDAVFWSVNYQSVSSDGTVDPDKGALVVYVSPSAVQSHAKKVRANSLKKFSFGATSVTHGKLWGATKPWTGVQAPPMPTCTVKQLTQSLQSKGLSGSKTVRVSFDPKWGYDWSVESEDPALKGKYSIEDCSRIGD